MAVPTTQWDETAPAGASNISQGDDSIRLMKTQLREVIAVDHEMTSTQTASTGGQHIQVTLQEQADLGTGAVDACILGSQTVDGKGELVYSDEDDNDIQITDTGNVNAAALGGVYAVDDLAAVAAILEHVYPVGCIFTAGVSTNPATLLGIGTWSALESVFIVGKDSSGTFDTLDATGGAETVKLSAAESGLPEHTHTYDQPEDSDGGGSGEQEAQDINGGTATSGVVGGAAEAASAHENLPPYVVKYVWQRAS